MPLRTVARRLPGAPLVYRRVARLRFPGTQAYWERRYAAGGTSGSGSSGEIAAWKGSVVSALVDELGITGVVELGCGDGVQLLSCRYPRYLGLDVSRSAVERCIALHRDDPTKSFATYDPTAFHDPAGFFRADAAVSLEVLFHLVEEESFTRYLAQLFACAERFVIVCATDTADVPGAGAHERHRPFTPWVREHLPAWEVLRTVPPPEGLPIASGFTVLGRRP